MNNHTGQINVALIGAGRMGTIRAAHLTKLNNVSIQYVVNTDPNKLANRRHEFGLAKLTNDSNLVLGDPRIHAIVICTPTSTHSEYIAKAASAGKAIFCEKPISHEIKETKDALLVVKKEGVILQVGFQRRHDKLHKVVKQKIDEGAIGAIRSIAIFSKSPKPPQKEILSHLGGMFLDKSIHDFDLIRWFSGREPLSLYATGNATDPVVRQLGDLDETLVVIKLSNGIVASIHNSRIGSLYDQRVWISGTKGNLHIPNVFTTLRAGGMHKRVPVRSFQERYTLSFKNELAAFIDCVHRGRLPSVTGDDALAAELIAHAANQSVKIGRPIKLQNKTI